MEIQIEMRSKSNNKICVHVLMKEQVKMKVKVIVNGKVKAKKCTSTIKG